MFFWENIFRGGKNVKKDGESYVIWKEMVVTYPSFLRCRKFMNQLVTGYLPSVVLMLFLYIVPPTMMLFSAVEGSFSRSGRKKSACRKVLYFMIWNVFFVNVLSGSVISQLNVISSPKGIPAQLARAVPTQVISQHIHLPDFRGTLLHLLDHVLLCFCIESSAPYALWIWQRVLFWLLDICNFWSLKIAGIFVWWWM